MSEPDTQPPLTSSPIFFITLFAGASVVVLSFLSFWFTIRHRRRLAAREGAELRNGTIPGIDEGAGGGGGGGRKKKKQLGPRPKLTDVILDYGPEKDPLSWKDIQPLSAGILPHARVPDPLPTQPAESPGASTSNTAITSVQGDNRPRQRRASMITQIVLPSPSLFPAATFQPPAPPQAPVPPQAATNINSVTASPPSSEATLMRVAVVITMPCAEFGMPALTLGMYDLAITPGTDDGWKLS